MKKILSNKIQKSRKLYKKILYFVIFLFGFILFIFSSVIYIRNLESENNYKNKLLEKDRTIFEFYFNEFFKNLKSKKIEHFINDIFKRSEYLHHLIYYDIDFAVLKYFSKDNLKIDDLPKASKSQKNFDTYVNTILVSVYVFPVYFEDKLIGYIQIGYNAEYFKNITIDNVKTIIVAVLLTLLFLILLISRMTNKIIAPIRQIVDSAEQVRNAKNIQKIEEIKTNDEIEELVKSFNFITTNLQDRIRDLSVIQSLALEINSELEKDRLLNKIAKIFADIGNCEYSAVLLLNEKKNALSLAAGLNLINHNYNVKLNEGVAGAAIFTGNYKLVNNIARYPDYLMFYHPDELKKSKDKELLALPLAVKDEVIGAVCLAARKQNKKIENYEIIFFQTIANSAAIAIENANLYELAITDGLTKLYIHRYFQMKLDEEINYLTAEEKSLCLIMLDIDYFKKLNDTYGHQQGDIVLKKVAELLKKSVRIADVHKIMRRADTVARYGGEEFAIILPDTNYKGAAIVAERIRHIIQEYEFPSADKPLRITVSLGIAEYDQKMTKSEFIKTTNKALYYSKKTGRNKITLYKDIVSK